MTSLQMERSSDQQQKQKETKVQQRSSDQPLQNFQFGNITIPLLPLSHSSSFKPLKGQYITEEQHALLTALWKASTSTAKLNALNALNFYFSNLNPKESFIALYNGLHPGIYNKSFDLVKERNSIYKRFYSFSEAHSSLCEHLKTTKFFIEKPEEGSSSSSQIVLKSPHPQQRSYEQVLTEDLKKDQEIKRLLESVDYWRSLPEANRKQLSVFEEQMKTEREEFSEKINILEAQNQSLSAELHRANSMVITLSSELRAYEEPPEDRVLFDMSFEKMTRHISLLQEKKDFFLSTIQDYVPEIAQDIVDRADALCFQTIQKLQLKLASCIPQPISGIIVVQKSNRFLIPGDIPSRQCLLAVIIWEEVLPDQRDFVSDLFFYGMTLKIIVEPNQLVPAFLGPTIVSAISNFRGDLPFTLCVSSDFPTSFNSVVTPAHHQMFIYQCNHRNTFPYETPQTPAIIIEEEYYSSFIDHTEPSLTHWCILAKTEIITVWISSHTYGFEEKVRLIHNSSTSSSSSFNGVTFVDSDGNSL